MKKKLMVVQCLFIIILGAITTLGIVAEIRYYSAMKNNFLSGASFDLISYIAISVFLLYYVLYNYKKPHGNLLKYLFLAFAVCILAGVVSIKAERNMLDNIFNYARGLVVILLAYLSGRLDRYKQNIAIIVAILALMLGTSILSTVYIFVYGSYDVDFWSIIDCYDSFVLCLDLMVAYLFRYREHISIGKQNPAVR